MTVISAEDASREAFYTAAQKSYDIYNGETLVAIAEFAAEENAITVRFLSTALNDVMAAGKGFFEDVLQALGVKSVCFEDDRFIEVTPQNIGQLASALFDKIGGGQSDFDGKSADFVAKIQPVDHVEFQDEFSVTFYNEARSMANKLVVDAHPPKA